MRQIRERRKGGRKEERKQGRREEGKKGGAALGLSCG